MAKNRKTPDMNLPVWFDGQNINEALFCEEFLQERRIIFANGAFFTPNGRVTDDLPLRGEIYDKLKFCAVNNIPRKITNILEVLKLEAQVPDFPPEQDRIHLSNGTLLLDGTFTEGRPAIVRSRLPVAYNPNAPAPEIWQNFLDGLLHAEDIPTLQEFIGYCLIPSNKGQRMMVIKGNGGEGKSQIGAVLSSIFGTNMKDGSIGKISENRFARADLEHILLCVDDDMRMEALRQTNYVKSIVTAQGKMDLERKGKQSYQGWMFARLLAFSNGDLQALYDRSDGFYRRQLVLTTKERPVNRADDPDLAEKMKAEAEGIFLWALEGLRRLVASNFKFTESDRIRENREAVKRDNNNIFDFMESEGYIRRKADASISSKDFYEIYRMWCEENSLAPLKARSFSDAMIVRAKPCLPLWSFSLIRKTELWKTNKPPAMQVSQHCFSLQKKTSGGIINVGSPTALIYTGGIHMDNNSLSHTKWNCKYHIVFAPKYRRKVAYGKIKQDIADILSMLCKRKGVKIIEAEICPDHVHMLVEIPPSISVSYFVGYLKGKSTLMIFERHANLKYKYGNRHFWCRGYYVDTVGKNAKKIQEYIANQLQDDLEYDQMTLKEYIDPFTGEPVKRNK